MPTSPGLFQNLVPSGSKPPAQGTGGGLDIGTLVQVRNQIWNSVLPAGRLRTALLSSDGSLLGAFKTMISLISGRKYTQGQYTLGERLIDQIRCGNVGWRDVPDEAVPLARLVFTMLFGVRIMTVEDLDALQAGANAYYGRGNKSDIPRNAVDRAVYLKQTYFPDSTYNNSCWDLSIFERYPLIAPIPAMNMGNDDNANLGQLYSGPGLNGTKFINGRLAPNSSSTGLTENLQTNNMGQPLGVSNASLQKYAPIFALLLVLGVFVSIKFGLYKP